MNRVFLNAEGINLSAVSMLVLLVDAWLFVPDLLVAAFNPVSLNLTTAALSVIVILSIDKTRPLSD